MTGPEKSEKIFFGGGRRLESKGKYTIPATIKDQEVMIEFDVLDANIPLLLSRREMKKLGVKIDFGKYQIEILGIVGPLLTTSNGLPIIELRQNGENERDTKDQRREVRDEDANPRINRWEHKKTKEDGTATYLSEKNNKLVITLRSADNTTNEIREVKEVETRTQKWNLAKKPISNG